MKNEIAQKIRDGVWKYINYLLILSPIIILFYLFMPLTVITAWYLSNDKFKDTWNKTLDDMGALIDLIIMFIKDGK